MMENRSRCVAFCPAHHKSEKNASSGPNARTSQEVIALTCSTLLDPRLIQVTHASASSTASNSSPFSSSSTFTNAFKMTQTLAKRITSRSGEGRKRSRVEHRHRGCDQRKNRHGEHRRRPDLAYIRIKNLDIILSRPEKPRLTDMTSR